MNPEIIQELKGRLGTVIGGRWKLVKILGLGASAGVYRGVDEEGWRVAVKVMHSKFLRSRIVRERFLREQSILDQVQHRHTLRIYETAETLDGLPYIVMELLEGQTLARIMSKRGEVPLELERVVNYMLPVLEALELCHGKQILHRDLKPANIFLTQEGVIKLLDFGVARFHQDGKNLTRDGATLGTPSFMSPEQASGKMDRLDARSDIFSVGATMHYLLSGQYLHQEETAQMTYLKAATSPAPSLERRAPHLDSEMIALVDRAVAWNASERWQTASEMAVQLRTVMDALNMKAARRRAQALQEAGRGTDSMMDSLARTTEDQHEVTVHPDGDVKLFWNALERVMGSWLHQDLDDVNLERDVEACYEALKKLITNEQGACVLTVQPYGLLLESAGSKVRLWSPPAVARQSCYALAASGIRKIRFLSRMMLQDLTDFLSLLHQAKLNCLNREDDLATAIWSKQIVGVEFEVASVLGVLEQGEYNRLDQAFALQLDGMGETLKSEFALESERMQVLHRADDVPEELWSQEQLLVGQRDVMEHQEAGVKGGGLRGSVDLVALRAQHKQQRASWSSRFGVAIGDVLQEGVSSEWVEGLQRVVLMLSEGGRADDVANLLAQLVDRVTVQKGAQQVWLNMLEPDVFRALLVTLGVLPGRYHLEIEGLSPERIVLVQKVLHTLSTSEGYATLFLDVLCSSTHAAEQLRADFLQALSEQRGDREALILAALPKIRVATLQDRLLALIFSQPERKGLALMSLYDYLPRAPEMLALKVMDALMQQPHHYKVAVFTEVLGRLFGSQNGHVRHQALRFAVSHKLADCATPLARQILRADFHLFMADERRLYLDTLKDLSLDVFEQVCTQILNAQGPESISTQVIALELLGTHGKSSRTQSILETALIPAPTRSREVQQAANRALDVFVQRQQAGFGGRT